MKGWRKYRAAIVGTFAALGVWLAAGPVHGYDPNLAAQENCRKE